MPAHCRRDSVSSASRARAIEIMTTHSLLDEWRIGRREGEDGDETPFAEAAAPPTPFKPSPKPLLSSGSARSTSSSVASESALRGPGEVRATLEGVLENRPFLPLLSLSASRVSSRKVIEASRDASWLAGDSSTRERWEGEAEL